MEVNGREVGFAYNMRALKLIAEICPNRDLSKINDVILGRVGNIIENQTKVILAMNQGYTRSNEHKAENQKPLSEDELLDMSQEQFNAVFTAASRCIIDESKTHVETKPTKKAGTRQAKES